MNHFSPTLGLLNLLLILTIIIVPAALLYDEHREQIKRTVDDLKTKKRFIQFVWFSARFCQVFAVIFIVLFVLFSAGGLVSAFQYAHDAATRTTCQTNIHYLQTAIRNYMQEHDNHLPPQSNWKSELMPYIQFFEKEKVFLCPEEKKGVESYIYLGDKDIKIPDDMPLKEIPVILETKCRHRKNAYAGYLDSNLEYIGGEENRENTMALFMKKLSHLKETEQQQRP
ncbi:MAG: hypothetical protein IKX30_08700 [Victivallales bacterium]|nr:hypothetical protein [Victivallales bacterium]